MKKCFVLRKLKSSEGESGGALARVAVRSLYRPAQRKLHMTSSCIDMKTTVICSSRFRKLPSKHKTKNFETLSQDVATCNEASRFEYVGVQWQSGRVSS